MFRSKIFLVAAMFTALLAACAPATPAPIVTEEPATGSVAVVNSIDLQILESFPVQVHAVLRGDLPDAGCTKIDRIDQVREGNTFRLTLVTTTDPLALCAQAFTPFEEVVPLEVQGLPAGIYTVDADGVVGSFEFSVDNILEEQPLDTDVYPTDVEYVMAQQDVSIHAGVGGSPTILGQVFAGQVAQVTGTNFDGTWWQIVCPENSAGSCWVSADPALTQPTTIPHDNQPPPPGNSQSTDVQYVMAQQEVSIYGGPGTQYSIVGTVASGQTAKVTGVSPDNSWWRVVCPDDTVGDCWVTTDPSFTQPAQAPG